MALALGCLYLIVMHGHLLSIDGVLMYRQAQSLAWTHALRFPMPSQAWWAAHPHAHLGQGTVMTSSRYGLGLSLLYVPGLLLWQWIVGRPLTLPALSWPDPAANDASYTIMGAPVHVVVTVLGAYMVARCVRDLGYPLRIRMWALALYGVASPAIVYAGGDWAQPLEGLCWITALYAGWRWHTTERRVAAVTTCALATGYALLTRPVEGTLLLPAVLLVLVPHPWTRRCWSVARMPLLATGVAFLASGVITLLVNWGRFGSPFNGGYGGEHWSTPLLTGLHGTLLSPGRGIAWEFPAILLVPFGVRALWRSPHRGLLLALLGLAGAQLLNVSLWDVWWGGGNWGLRLFVPAFPLLAVIAACGLGSMRLSTSRWAGHLTLWAGVLWAIPCVAWWGNVHMAAGASDAWSAYPPLGAWDSLTRAQLPYDVWLQLAPRTGPLILLGPLLLAVVGLLLLRQASSTGRV